MKEKNLKIEPDGSGAPDCAGNGCLSEQEKNLLRIIENERMRKVSQAIDSLEKNIARIEKALTPPAKED